MSQRSRSPQGAKRKRVWLLITFHMPCNWPGFPQSLLRGQQGRVMRFQCHTPQQVASSKVMGAPSIVFSVLDPHLASYPCLDKLTRGLPTGFHDIIEEELLKIPHQGRSQNLGLRHLAWGCFQEIAWHFILCESLQTINFGGTISFPQGQKRKSAT